MTEDKRFDRFKTDPKFKSLRKNRNKVKLDDRFTDVLSKSGDFNLEWKRDRYGKKLVKSSSENFNRFYEGNAHKSRKEARSRILDDKDDDQNKELGKDFDKIRGMAEVDSSESEPDSESEAESEGDDLYERAKDDVKHSEDISPRLAMQNMDWDRMKAVDIYVLVASVLPEGGLINKVTIYMSEFGKKMTAIEAKEGPRLADTSKEDLTEEDRLRAYQLERLKYCYAVIETDSSATADAIYTKLDGQCVGESGSFIDLRFIPDHVSFEEDAPRSQRTTNLPDVCTQKPRNYDLPEFVTSALSRTKVNLTWDEQDQSRKSIVSKLRKGDLVEDQISHLLASGSESEDEDAVNKYRALVQSGGASNSGNSEFQIQSKAAQDDDSDDSDDNLISDEEKEQSEAAESSSEDEQQKEELDLLMFDPEDQGKEDFAAEKQSKEKGKRKKRKRQKKQMAEGADLKDSRFGSALLNDPEFAVDRTHSSYKPSKTGEELHRKRTAKHVADILEGKTKESGPVEAKKPAKEDSRDIIARLKMRNKK